MGRGLGRSCGDRRPLEKDEFDLTKDKGWDLRLEVCEGGRHNF